MARNRTTTKDAYSTLGYPDPSMSSYAMMPTYGTDVDTTTKDRKGVQRGIAMIVVFLLFAITSSAVDGALSFVGLGGLGSILGGLIFLLGIILEVVLAVKWRKIAKNAKASRR